ncbi:MAG: hypothetical protein H6R11_2469 [Proteobacteria bacterium]|nr:hypothetical protein [Pseudomonadota bacterium]
MVPRESAAATREVAVAHRHLGGMEQPPAGGADLVQRNAAQRRRQAHRAADLVLDPGHAGLVRAHVRAEDVVLLVSQGVGEGTDQTFLAFARHARIAVEHRLAAAVGQAGRRVLQRHGAGEAEAFDGADIGRHAQAADGGAAGDVVHHQHGLQAEGRLMDMDDLGGTELVGVTEYVFHR